MNRAVFLDRDGVLIADVDLLIRHEQLRLLAGVPASLRILKNAGFHLVVVSNQSVVARGLATERDVECVNAGLDRLICSAGGPAMNGFYFCPHHPNATLARYRVNCDCRKPRPGMLFRAAQELRLDLSASFMVGDRITDIIAGARAGCRTVLVETGKHRERPIEINEPLDLTISPDHVCEDLPTAAEWIVKLK